MRAFCLIRPEPCYRREAFERGLKAAGYALQQGVPKGAPGDVLVIWNRYWDRHELATRFEQQGGRVVVAENGYLGVGGSTPKWDVHPAGPRPEHYYALAIGGHNGSGDSATSDPARWDALGIELRPWREDGLHVLVCPSRTFGRPDMTMPADWTAMKVRELRRHTRRPIRVREHPKNNKPARDLTEDLEGAWAMVIWASSAGIHALVRGIPVIRTAPHWILQAAAGDRLDQVETPAMPNRLPAFHHLAASQWRVDEIEAGLPFKRLLQ